MITASSLGRSFACEGSNAVEHVDETNEYQEPGNERHANEEAAIKRGEIQEWMTQRWLGYTWRSEVKFAYSPATRTARELTEPGHRNYSGARPGELCGQTDVLGMPGVPALGVVAAGPIVIGDWKGHDPNVPRAHVNAQLHIGALAWSRIFNIDAADVFLSTEGRKPDVASLDVMDLDAFAADVAVVLAKGESSKRRYLAGEPVEFVEGPWCRWAPCFAACPKKNALVASVANGSASNRIELLSLHDDEVAEDAWEFLANLKMLTKRLEARCRARIAERPIKLRSGKYLGVVESQGNRVLDGRKVRDIVRGKYGEAVADACVELETSQKLIKEQFAAHLPRGQVTGAMEKLLAELESVGGVTRKKSTDIMEVDDVRKCKTVQRIANEDIVPAPEASLAGGKR